VLARAVVRDYFQPREAARVFSFLMLVIGVSPVVAPLVGGYWWCLPAAIDLRGGHRVGIACLLSVAIFLRETLPRERRRPLSISDVLGCTGGYSATVLSWSTRWRGAWRWRDCLRIWKGPRWCLSN
jgi:MFS family permease